jgi:hypothetical protein
MDAADDDVGRTVVVSFDIDICVRHTCPQDYHVGDTHTRFFLSEAETTAVLTCDDRALLALADTAAEAASAMLFDRRPPGPHAVDRRQVADPPESGSPHPPILTHTSMTITGPCPMSFQVAGREGGEIVVLDSTTLCLNFDERALLEFARLASQAARTVHARTTQTDFVS